jgi:hypothetical protein
VRQDGIYDFCRRKLVDYENAFDAWPEKHVLGTQLGQTKQPRLAFPETLEEAFEQWLEE